MAKNETLRVLQRVSEHILRASSPADIAQKLAEELPSVTRATSVRLYRFNVTTKSLESIPCASQPEPAAGSIEHPPEGLMTAAARCFRDRIAINMVNARRDAEVNPTHQKGFPRSAFFAPICFGLETLGVLEALSNRRFGSFTWEERCAIQQLANLAGALMKLQQQGQVQEAARGEKRSSETQAIADAASTLRPALEQILALSSELADQFPAAARLTSDLRAEALRASEAVARAAVFSPTESAAPVPFDLNALLRDLVQFRTPHWEKLGLQVQKRIGSEPAMILGHRAQIERAALDLIVLAERSASASRSKTLALGSGATAGRFAVEISFPSSAPVDAAGLKASRAIAESHRGELNARATGDAILLEMELPIAALPLVASSLNRKDSRILTLMLVDSDGVARAELLSLLAQRGHRVIPAPATEASVLATRMRFDGVIWALRSGGGQWSEYQQLLRDSIPGFALVSDAYDEALASSLAEGGTFLLSRPILDADLDRMIEALVSRATTRV